jgi:exopolysaccharide biosynthesis polyprenyl glycosylphosphotransferase
LHANLSRGYVAIAAAVTIPLTLLTRYAARKQLHGMLLRGGTVHTVVVAGSAHEIENVVAHIKRAPYAGFRVVKAFVLDGGRVGNPELTADIEMVAANVDDLARLVKDAEADTLAIAGTSVFPTGALRRLSWSLEDKPIQLIVAPAVTDFAGPRIVVRPVDGLPLLHIDEPDLSGAKLALKAVLDTVLATCLLLLLSPVLVAIAGAILVTEGRPVLFKQSRVGHQARPFRMWKFRTMVVGAERQRAELDKRNDHDGLLFKLHQDPRVTTVGRFLRRHSLDEMPQLFNVVRGSMSLVGPRPPLPAEVELYGDEMRRRLLVKPGMTGLWQINGRSDLPWPEAVRLDLFYVENWTPALDLMVLWKTLPVVIRGRGGY